MIPEELQKNVPREIYYSDELFSKNRKKVKSIFIDSILIIPLVGLLFWWRFDDLISGLIWGIGIAAFCELMGVALMINAKKAVNLCQNGMVTLGTVQSSKITGNTGRYTNKDSAGYIFIHVSYSDNASKELKG